MSADPAKKLASDINSLRTKFNTLEESTRLTSVRDSVEDTQATIKGFAGKVAELRTRGYVFGRNFESRAEALLTGRDQQAGDGEERGLYQD